MVMVEVYVGVFTLIARLGHKDCTPVVGGEKHLEIV